MTMLELDQTTAEEYCQFMIDGELDEIEMSIHDLISDINPEWYFTDEYDEVINTYGLDSVVTIDRVSLEELLNAAD